MKATERARRSAAVLACVVSLIAAVSAASAQPAPTQIVGVASVTDGDTIEIHGARIRLDGIDAPESGSMCGGVNVYQRSSLALSELLGQRTVTCAVSGQDRYGRSIAQCSVGGDDVATRQVEAGWARDWPRYSNGSYQEAELVARAERRGVWASECPEIWGNRDYSR